MTHIRSTLEHCNIVEEVFSSFTFSWVTPSFELSANAYSHDTGFQRYCQYKSHTLFAG